MVSSQDVMTVDSAYVLTALSYTIIALRALLRRLKHEKFHLDDYLMLFATLIYAVNTAVYPVIIYNGVNIDQNDPKKLWPENAQHATLGSKFVLISRPFYMSYVWCMKACMLIYYTRLTSRTKELLAVQITAGLVAVTWVACMLTFFLECRPIHLYWQVVPYVPQCAKAIDALIVMGSTNMFTDLLIMVIPLPIIIRAKLRLKTKIKLCLIFLVGIFMILVSVMRLVFVFRSLTEQNKLLWGQLECFAATVVANAPILHGLWCYSCNRTRGRISISSNTGNGNHGGGKPRIRIAVRPASGSAESIHSIREHESDSTLEEVNGSSRRTRLRNSIRNSIRRIIRRSIEPFEIERTTVLLQESKTVEMEQHKAPPTGDYGVFLGHGLAGNAQMASISTEISGSTTVCTSTAPRRYRYACLFGRSK